jgi:putative DNA primase/helicase
MKSEPESTLEKLAQQHREQHRQRQDTGRNVLPPPTQPMQVAEVFVEQCCKNGRTLTLRYWRGGWWTWQQSHWEEREEIGIRALLYRFTEHAVYQANRLLFADWAPNRRKIGDLLEALKVICVLSERFNQPSWLDHRNCGVIVACANGLLDVERRALLPHSPLFFNQTSVPFDYRDNPPEPVRWLDFLTRLWPTEPAAIYALGEWFGYVISGRLDLHKIFLMVGPTRSGKGVIARVLGSLVGKHNTCGPTLHSLGGDFGLAPLIGKPLAVIADARFVGKNGNVVVERLLSISGEDTLTVNRKYRDHWSGKLPSRLHIISNELPPLGDASEAIIGRMVVLLTSQSWLNREDHGLESALQGELSGILNWALNGLERLTIANRNRFTHVPSAAEAISTMHDLASPVGAFVRQRCRIGAGLEIGIELLFEAYKTWCDLNNQPKTTKQVFGRDLGAVVPSIKITRPGSEGRHRVYTGLTLREAE